MSDQSQHRRLEATVKGRVQGVGFRYFVLDHAARLGLTGYVRNLPLGGVEVVAEGDAAALEQLQSQLEKGPAGAHVSAIEADITAARGEFTRFEIRR